MNQLLLIILGVLLFLFCVWLFKYVQSKRRITNSEPYALSYVKGRPKTYTWLIHAYVPDHNAGSEWMAHAMNTFLIREMGYTIHVVSNKTSVPLYERVKIVKKSDKEEARKAVDDATLLLTHHTMEPNAVKTAALVKKPLVLVLHDHNRHRALSFYKDHLPGNLYCIANSEWIRKYYSDLGLPTFVLYPPVSYRDYEVVPTREYVTLINVNLNKGGKVLIEIAKRMPDVKFLGVKGAYNKQYLLEDAPSNIVYVGSTPRVKEEIYAKTDILLMPSKEESWGRTAIEAMSSGIPVIAHPTEGLLESCGSAGLFCDREDIDAWVREIRKLKTDSEFYAKKSEECKRRARELDPEPQLAAMAVWLEKIKWKEI